MKRYSLMKKICSGLMAILVGVVLMPAVKVHAASTYTVTFRPGNVGTFDTSNVAALYGSNVEITSHGAIKITVNAGDAMPAAYPYVTPNEGYFVKSWGPSESTVTQNVDYVVDYGKLVDGVEYTVKYVDSKSGESVAPFVTQYGNIGETVEATAPATLTTSDAGTYVLQSVATQSLTLTEDALANVLVFEYTNNYNSGTVVEEVVNYVDGGTTNVTETYVTTIDNGTTVEPGANVIQGGGNGNNAADNGAQDNPGNVTIEEEDTPLADAVPGADTQEQDNQGEVVIIEDGATPLSDTTGSAVLNPVVLWAGAAGLAAMVLTMVWVISKRKRAAVDEEK